MIRKDINYLSFKDHDLLNLKTINKKTTLICYDIISTILKNALNINLKDE